MRGSIRLFRIFGISINIHVTFFLLLLIFLAAGLKSLVLIMGIFFIVTMHELCHALVARHFGIEAREITLLPIGGLASMAKLPEKPSHEFFISLAGPLFNLVMIALFFFPMRLLVGDESLFHSFSVASWPLTFAQIYWTNLALALFNLIPAFPMDGGRIMRALLARGMGHQKATRIAVNFGHVFAIIFGSIGIVQMNLLLIAIALFIYIAASSEELQEGMRETLKKIRIRDILTREFLTLRPDLTLADVLAIVFRSHQEDFPVIDGTKAVGFVTRQDIIVNVHRFGSGARVADIMRREFPRLNEQDTLIKAHALMQEKGFRALPVFRGDAAVGVVTLEDIGKVYALTSSVNGHYEEENGASAHRTKHIVR